MTIRKFRESDIDDVYNISLRELTNSSWTKRMLMDTFASDTCIVYVAIIEGQVVGFCSAIITCEDCNILDIAVSKDYKRMGIGTKLFGKVIKFAKLNKIPHLSLEVSGKNEIAINFYKKIGFDVISKRKKYYSNGDDALVMFFYI